MSIARSLLPALAFCLALVAGPLAAGAEELGIIPTRVIYPGETIGADALQMARVKPSKATTTTAFAHRPEELVGKVARRTLLPGRFVALSAVRDPYLIPQGAAVQVMFVSGGLSISTKAVTLQPGSAGDVVKVRNTDSGAIFSATVMEDGTVRVGDS